MEKRIIEVVDSTILGTLDECPRKAQYQFQMGMKTRGEHRALDFGKAYHAGVGAWYKSGKNLNLAVIGFNQEYTSCITEDFPDKEVRTHEKGQELLCARDRLFKSEEWEIQGDPEQQFVLDIPGCPMRYAGFIDAFGRETKGEMQYVVQEEKTSTSPWIFCPHPNAQITGYIYAARSLFKQDIRRAYLTMAGIYKSSIDGRVKGKKKDDPLREVVNREIIDLDPWDLEEWVDDVRVKMLSIKIYQAGWIWWPKNTRSCGNYGGCPYQPICLAPPNMREAFLESNFEQEFWSPLDERR